MASHTTTGEWKSFEQRMRRRRAERLLLRADVAAEAGCIEDAEAALAEARRLVPTLPNIADVERRIHDAVAPPSERAASRYRRQVYWSIAAALVILVVRGVWQASHTQRLPAHNVAAAVPAAAPAVGDSSAAAARVGVVVERVPVMTTIGAPVATTIGTSGHSLSDASDPAIESAAPTSVPTATYPAVEAAADRSAPLASSATAESVAELPAESLQPVSDVAPHTTSAPPLLNLGQPVATAPSVPTSGGTTRSTVPPDETLVRRTLGRYAAAFSNLDADAAHAVWPAVNRGALARAFDDLESQHVSLGDCRVDVTGARARAACLGSATWAPKVGSGTPRTEPRSWQFELAKKGADWQIVSARVQNR
jgi:hypothetical protein